MKIQHEAEYTPEEKSSKTCFNKSAVTDHIAKANHVMDWEGAKVVDRENNQRLRQVKEAIIRISQSPRAMNQDPGAYSLSNIYRPLFTTNNQSNGKQSQSCNIMRSWSQSDDGSRLEPKLLQ